jgi:D-sedoheptulose 7-phosphate isomerase
MTYSEVYLDGISQICQAIQPKQIENIVEGLIRCRERNGRIFCIGVGGGAANASHAVNDFRKICNIESYCLTDNVAELTARINDEGWDTSCLDWLYTCRLKAEDTLMVFSVGGGTKDVSANIVNGVSYAKSLRANIYGIVGRDGGYTKKVGNEVIVIPTIYNHLVTAYTESMQMVILHAIVFHPKLMVNKGKWESINEH